jgi:hypothetical protein
MANENDIEAPKDKITPDDVAWLQIYCASVGSNVNKFDHMAIADIGLALFKLRFRKDK